MDTLFTSVRLLDPASGLDQLGDLLVRDGRIADLGSGLGRPDGVTVIAEDGAPQDVFGAAPKGYLVLTPEGRSIVLTTATGRKGGMDDASRVALHKSMLAYTGRYRVEGSDFVTAVEISWNEEWNGTEQRRHYRIEGDTLFIETTPAPSMVSPGETDFRRLKWVREQ